MSELTFLFYRRHMMTVARRRAVDECHLLYRRVCAGEGTAGRHDLPLPGGRHQRLRHEPLQLGLRRDQDEGER